MKYLMLAVLALATQAHAYLISASEAHEQMKKAQAIRLSQIKDKQWIEIKNGIVEASANGEDNFVYEFLDPPKAELFKSWLAAKGYTFKTELDNAGLITLTIWW